MNSPFANILHTNITPSDAESRIIRNLVGEWRKDLANSTEEIDRLQSLIDKATRKRDELNQFIDAHLALVSPVPRLPDDIIREIFMATLSSSRNSAMSLKEAPLLLCQICHSWRLIALCTPRLWASIHIVIPNAPRLPQLMESVIPWLERSGTVPLDISMAYSLEADARCDISPLMSTLVALAPRWRHIRNSLQGNSHHFTSLSSTDVPLLRAITLDQSGERSTELFTFLGTESLRSLQLQNNKGLLQTPVSWGTLQHLTISRCRQALRHGDALKILQRCPLLETCHLVVCGGNPLGGVVEPFSLPHLTRLSVTYGHSTSNVPRLFSSLILPALSTFHCCDENTKLLFLHSRTLFPSDTSNLQCFWINLRDLNSVVLVDALKDMPNLHELHILREPFDHQNPFLNRKFLLRFGADAGGPVCPRLQYLALEQFEELSDETLLQFLQSRAQPIAQPHPTGGGPLQTVVPLSHFSCSFERTCDRDIMPDIQGAIAAGLVVKLKYLILEEDVYSPFEGIDMETF